MKTPTPSVYLFLLALLLAAYWLIVPPEPSTMDFQFSQPQITSRTYPIAGYSLERGWFAKGKVTIFSDGSGRIVKYRE